MSSYENKRENRLDSESNENHYLFKVIIVG